MKTYKKNALLGAGLTHLFLLEKAFIAAQASKENPVTEGLYPVLGPLVIVFLVVLFPVVGLLKTKPDTGRMIVLSYVYLIFLVFSAAITFFMGTHLPVIDAMTALMLMPFCLTFSYYLLANSHHESNRLGYVISRGGRPIDRSKNPVYFFFAQWLHVMVIVPMVCLLFWLKPFLSHLGQ